MLDTPFTYPSQVAASKRSATLVRGVGGNSGNSVANAGDVNSDGIDDVIIGASTADGAGAAFVIFGGKDLPDDISLAELDGQNGFRVNGIASGDYTGYPVSSAGDINGDGISDFMVSASRSSPGGRPSAGSVFIVFGKKEVWGPTLDLSTLNGQNGFRINGIAGQTGVSMGSAGDINGDGLSDLIIGAPYSSPAGILEAGSAFVVYGKREPWNATLELSEIDGKNGFRVNGVEYDQLGYGVTGAGDIDADGLHDLIIGAPYSPNTDTGYDGVVYVIFGNSTISSVLDVSTLDGTNGFRIDGVLGSGGVGGTGGASSRLNDFNGDNLGDFIIGASSSYVGNAYTGSAFVMFGQRRPWNATVDLATLNGNNGFRINGVQEGSLVGTAVSGGEDINGDGLTDLLVGAYATTTGNTYDGSTHVIFGHRDAWAPSMSISSLNGENGFFYYGCDKASYCYNGKSIAIGNFNGDDVGDFIASAPGDINYRGDIYIVYGNKANWVRNQLAVNRGEAVRFSLDNLNVSASFNAESTTYTVNSVQNGLFEYIDRPEVPIYAFNHQEIDNGLVRFVHDGSENAPSYEIRARYMLLYSTAAANITFGNPSLEEAANKDVAPSSALVTRNLMAPVPDADSVLQTSPANRATPLYLFTSLYGIAQATPLTFLPSPPRISGGNTPTTFSAENMASIQQAMRHGALQGMTNTIGNTLKKLGCSERVTNAVKQVVYYSGFFALRLSVHQSKQEEGNKAQDTPSAAYQAAIDTGTMLFANDAIGKLQELSGWFSDKAANQGWTGTSKTLKAVATHGGMAKYAFNAYANGGNVIGAAASVVAGIGAEKAGENMTKIGRTLTGYQMAAAKSKGQRAQVEKLKQSMRL